MNSNHAAPADLFFDGLARGRPETHGVSSRGIVAFLDEVAAANLELHSFMLYRGGAVIAEGWWSPYHAGRLHMMHSLTKSVTACGVGLALAEGRFGLHDKVASFFDDLLPGVPDANLAAMTIEDLLTMRTGHRINVSGSAWRPIRTSWIAEFFKIPVPDVPGTAHLYTSAASYMLSAIITRTTGEPLSEYLRPRLFEPLGITGYEWPTGPHGISPGANGLSCRTADALKLGVLHARNGLWNGRQILPADWVAAVQAAHVPGKYGYQWWLGPDNYSARGLFGQFVFVFPNHDAVLAVTAAMPAGSNFTGRFVFRYFPALFETQPLPDNDDAFAALQARTNALCLTLPTGPAWAECAVRVSGKTYVADDNEDGVRALRFAFRDDQCRFIVEDARGTHEIDVGLAEPVEGNTSMTGHKLHHEYQPDMMRVVASGVWHDDRTFVMTWIFVESAFRDTVVCRFDGDNLTLERSVNVNSGALERPPIRGRVVASDT